MAETLVLANLIINADGTITAVNQAGQSVDILQQKVRKGASEVRSGFDKIGLSAKRLTDGFLNIRRAISGLFIGFSVGGVIFALGQMVSAAITSTTAWQNMKQSVGDFINEMVIGEGSLERFTRHLKNLGVNTAEDTAKRIADLTEELSKAKKVLASGTDDSGFFLGKLFKALVFGAVDDIKLTTEKMELLRKTVEATEQEVLKLTNQLEQMTKHPFVEALPDTSVREFMRSIGQRFTEEELPFRTEPILGDMRVFVQEIGEINSQLDFLRHGLLSGDVSFSEFMDGMTAGQATLQEYSASLLPSITDNVAALSDAFAAGLISSEEFTAGLESQGRRITAVYELMGAAFANSAIALVDMVASGEFSVKKMLAVVLRAIAAEAAVRGAFEIAEGFAAVGRYDPVSAAAHFTAAAKYFTVALLSAAASSVVSGGSRQGGSGGGSRRGLFESQAPPEAAFNVNRQGPVVTIVVDGGIFTGTPEELARIMTSLVRQGMADGA